MFKTWRILSVLILLSLSLLPFFPNSVSAATCSFTYNPAPPNQNMDKLSVMITSEDLAAGNTYRIVFYTPASRNSPQYTLLDLPFDPNTGITLEFNKPLSGWGEGDYGLFLVKTGDRFDSGSRTGAICTDSFTISEIPSQSCTASIPTHPIEPGTDIVLHVEGLAYSIKPFPDLGTGGYDILVFGKFKQVVTSLVYSTNSGKDIILGNKFDVGDYLVEVRNRCGFVGTSCSLGAPTPRMQCNAVGFKVASKGSGGGGEINPSAIDLSRKCKKIGDPSYNPSTDLLCTESGIEGCGGDGIKTAIGCIRTTPAELVKDVSMFIIGIGGGIAFLMMLLGAFQMLTSAGNPEALQAGRERLTSAIIGLLFVIFATLLLQVIGFDILKLPGFGR